MIGTIGSKIRLPEDLDAIEPENVAGVGGLGSVLLGKSRGAPCSSE